MGVLTKLADETKDINVEAITVVGGNVYVAGVDYSGAKNKTVYIRDGEAPVVISDGTVSTHGYSIAVVGSKVYTVGVVDGEIATLWEGKTATTLPLLDGMTRSEAHAIVVAGNKLYIAGFNGTGVGSGDPRPTLWIKDGTNPITIQALDDNDAEAYGLAVVGNDVYVAGVDLSGTKPAAVYWKNGKKQHISDNASAYGIAVEDDDIYVVGTEIAVESKSKLWKDGVATVLWEGGIGLSAKSIVLTKEVY